ncbi:hypothetical protein [Brevundimonas sp.]|uniref:hypothetical protein n=1 Tax=Brevundimonas sp. TaxID=1871086 RepID=UPI002E136430|nr:hypothetical protein [Brevundimonas sp.]
MFRLLTRVVLWLWLLIGGLGLLAAAFAPRQEHRLATMLVFGAGAAIGGGGLLIRRYVGRLVRFSQGRHAVLSSGEKPDSSQ